MHHLFLVLATCLALADAGYKPRFVNLYANENQPCGSTFSVALPEQMYQLNILVDRNVATYDMEIRLWNSNIFEPFYNINLFSIETQSKRLILRSESIQFFDYER